MSLNKYQLLSSSIRISKWPFPQVGSTAGLFHEPVLVGRKLIHRRRRRRRRGAGVHRAHGAQRSLAPWRPVSLGLVETWAPSTMVLG